MADYFDASRHDISLTDPSTSDVLGFVLKRKDGKPVYAEYDGKYLADQFFTDAATQSNLDPEKELLLGQSDWRSGFGLTIYDPDDVKRYESSYGCDLRFKNRTTLSYGATSISAPSSTSLSVTNGTMEADSHWTNGARSDVLKQGGTYSWKVGHGVTAYGDETWDNAYRKCYITVSGYIYQGGLNANTANIGIDDGVGATWSANSATTTAWTAVTVGRMLDGSATQLRIEMKNTDDADDDCYFDTLTISVQPTTGVPIKGVDFNAVHYVPFGNILTKLNGTGDGWTQVATFPATITDLAPMTISGTDYLFIACGLSDEYWYMTTAEAFTESNAAAPNYQFMEVVFTTAATMYGNDTNSTIRSTINPLNGGTAWSAATQVDNDYNDITSLFSESGALYIGKEDKPYYLDSSGNVQNDLAPECEALLSTTSGKIVMIWQGEIYYAVGAQGLLEIGTANTWVSPALYCTDLSDFNGKVSGLAADDMWLFAALNNSTKVEILAARDETIDGSTQWVWHPLKELTMTGCNAMWVSSIYQKRLWIASATSGQAIQYIPLPSGYGDVTSDTNRSFATGGYFTTPFLHGNFKETTKGLISITATLGHSYDADIYWTLSYKKLGDTDWTSLGNAVGTSTNRTHTLYRTTSTTSPMFQFKFVGVTDTANTSPELLSYSAKMILYPTIRKLIFCTVRVGDNVTDKAGLTTSNKTVLQKTCLNNARNATWLVSFTDIDGTSAKAKLLPLPSDIPRRIPIRDEKGKTIEWEYNLLLLEVATS